VREPESSQRRGDRVASLSRDPRTPGVRPEAFQQRDRETGLLLFARTPEGARAHWRLPAADME